MKNVTLLILEKGKCYGERLAAFLGRQAYSPFNIQLYLEHPISDEKWKKADLVLITSSLMALYGEKVKEGNVCIRKWTNNRNGREECVQIPISRGDLSKIIGIL